VLPYAHKHIHHPTILRAMPRPSSNDSGVPAVIIRAKMPLLPLSEMIAWFHAVIGRHTSGSKRWATENRELRNLCDRIRRNVGESNRLRAQPLTLEQKKEKAAEYQRRYRAKVKADREEKLRKIRQQDWAFWKARKEEKKRARQARWAKRFPWKVKKQS